MLHELIGGRLEFDVFKIGYAATKRYLFESFKVARSLNVSVIMPTLERRGLRLLRGNELYWQVVVTYLT